MSDILIKGMEMPKQCWNNIEYCPFHFKDYHGKSHCELSDDIRCLRTKRPKDCPLIEVREADIWYVNKKMWVEASTEGEENGNQN